MIVLGIVLMVIGFVFGLPISWTIGVILFVIGIIFWVLGATGHPVAHRKYWY